MAIVVATDFSEEAQRAAAVAAGIASRMQETLRLVHVSGDPRAPAFIGTPGGVLLVSELKALSDEAAALRRGTGGGGDDAGENGVDRCTVAAAYWSKGLLTWLERSPDAAPQPLPEQPVLGTGAVCRVDEQAVVLALDFGQQIGRASCRERV